MVETSNKRFKESSSAVRGGATSSVTVVLEITAGMSVGARADEGSAGGGARKTKIISCPSRRAGSKVDASAGDSGKATERRPRTI